MLLLKFNINVLGEGLLYTIIGFSIVLLVLILITCVLYIFSAVVNAGAKKSEPKEIKPPAPEPEPAVIEEPEPVYSEADDTELVAVITAAIAASLNTSSDKLVVRSIRKVNNWKRESIRQKNSAF